MKNAMVTARTKGPARIPELALSDRQPLATSRASCLRPQSALATATALPGLQVLLDRAEASRRAAAERERRRVRAKSRTEVPFD